MLLIGNGKVITRDNFKPIIDDGCIAVIKNKIVEIGITKDLKNKYSDAKFIDAEGKLIMPGFINTHMHYYSTFARGIVSDSPKATKLSEILKGLWWRLDKTLTLEDVYYSALVPMIDQVRNGVTTVFDHHASSSAVTGSLFKIADAAKEIGIRSNLCYETSDRDGEKICDEGIEENVAFIKYCNNKNDDMIKGMFGLHASMTISDKTLYKCLDSMANLNTGFHVHTGEGIEDAKDCMQKYGKGIVERWYDAGALCDKTISVHCIYIKGKEMDLLKEKNTIVVHNPESNMGNAVGVAPILEMYKKGILLGLGTDGYTSDMMESYKVANIIHKHVKGDSTVAFNEIPDMLFNNNRTITERFIDGKVGILKEGALADIIIVDYNPPTPINESNINSHLLFGINGRFVDTTIINGRVVMENRKLINIDEEKIMAKSRELASDVWNRF
ncbi:putative aminohydrolase SsnA [Clostridium estertheticum]|uniref:putative aminohydrolase SsnA n=1 Tax=Clostridium estertheticum TaxID=238834 RepID=UPI001CF1C20B|nr:putative aminohydrolase SsnA [Clostridium estertheticum]MCB2307421.1 putative aminohydrolase SsnA [Clostridium estertheticum]MCB2345678.1 putative aminohydrolase SsnA [Clostridium estertheticum]MCB2350910.1 putative aminohydrolase SsnA [Clostridium estertheticum]WAG44105.1 putative aminohydrolase SsnA [Clostridium estertheticum]